MIEIPIEVSMIVKQWPVDYLVRNLIIIFVILCCWAMFPRNQATTASVNSLQRNLMT